MNTPQVSLAKGLEDGRIQLEIRFDYHERLTHLIKSIPGIRWSDQRHCWLLPYSKAYVEAIQLLFKDVATLNELPDPYPDILNPMVYENQSKNNLDGLNDGLSPETWSEVERFRKWLELKNYSISTIGTYLGALCIFLRFFNNKPVKSITNEDVIRFNQSYVKARNLSPSYQNQTVNAIKLFFRLTHHATLDIAALERPKRPKNLPNILTRDEIKLLLNAPVNLKHRTMLTLIYSCGLRSSELLRLKPHHILTEKYLLQIIYDKSKPERLVPLSPKALQLLREYYRLYRPTVFLFEGKLSGTAYDERSLQQVLRLAVEKSGIHKPITLHWLRHSYATHLFETGTDIKVIQKLLGHKTSKSTETYSQLATGNIQQIHSPYDQLWRT